VARPARASGFCAGGAAPPSADESERADLLRAIAEGLADDAAGRTMDTRALKESLENELGPIA
jgi:hypothetical protein